MFYRRVSSCFPTVGTNQPNVILYNTLQHSTHYSLQLCSISTVYNLYTTPLNGGLGTFQGFGPRVELGSVQQQRPGNAHYAANSSLESSTSQPISQPSSQPTSQSTGQGISAHWDNLNQAYGQARQAAVKVPDRVCPPLVGGGTRDRGASSNNRPHTSAAFSLQFYNQTTFPGKQSDLAGGAGTMGKPLPNQP